MSPGGLSDHCDDCAWSACFKATECIRVRARQLGVAPQDLLDQAVWFGLDGSVGPDVLVVLTRNLTQDELDQLAAELPAGTPILVDRAVTHE